MVLIDYSESLGLALVQISESFRLVRDNLFLYTANKISMNIDKFGGSD